MGLGLVRLATPHGVEWGWVVLDGVGLGEVGWGKVSWGGVKWA